MRNEESAIVVLNYSKKGTSLPMVTKFVKVQDQLLCVKLKENTHEVLESNFMSDFSNLSQLEVPREVRLIVDGDSLMTTKFN